MLSRPSRFRPPPRPPSGQQRVVVRVRLRDDAHHVEICAGVLRYRGEIMHAPGSIRCGDEVHLRVFVESDGEGAANSRLVLLGEVIALDGAAKDNRLAAGRGVEFTMLIQRASVRGRDVAPGALPRPVDVAPQPDASAAPVPHAEVAANLHANHPAFSEDLGDDVDATEILSQLSLASLARSRFDVGGAPSDLAPFEDEDTLVMVDVEGSRVSTVAAFEGEQLQTSLPTSAPPPPRQQARLPSRRRAPDSVEFTGVSGRIERMGVVEVVQSLDVLRRTGRVEFYTDDGDGGAVFVDGGQVTHAEYSVFVGRDAFVELLQFERGSFQIHFDRTSPETTIEQPTGFLILDCMTQIDEVRAQKREGTQTAVMPTPVLSKERRDWLAPPS